MKIVYCTDSICYAGGIQRITVAKANALAEIKSNEVWIIVTDNKQKPVLSISDKVHIIDLDVNYFEDDWKSKWHVLKGILVKRKIHKKRLTTVLNQIQPDIVISTGTSEKNFLPKISVKSKPAFVREIHQPRNYRLLSADNLFDKFIAIGGNLIDYHFNIKNYDKTVVLTEEDHKNNWKNNSRITVIPNPLTLSCNECSSVNNKVFITAGRLAKVKNFHSLINAWHRVIKIHPNWILEIWGDGGERIALKSLIVKLNLNKHVYLKGYSNNIQFEMLKASAFVLTSIFEGFGLVIVEAMSCGLPVVSYACPCGPKDIISEGKDGYLVPVNDEEALAEKICLLIEDEEKRKEMGKAAKAKAEQYSVEHITDMWMKLFNALLHERK